MLITATRHEKVITVYLAGPDVFAEDAAGIINKKVHTLVDAGFDVITPLDSYSNDPVEIMNFNMEAIKKCDLVLADLSPFRGTEPDSGTVFETGVAIALGRKVYAYGIPDGTYREQVNDFYHAERDSNYCPVGFFIEDFGLPLNLMLATNVKISKPGETFADVVSKIDKNLFQ